MKCSVWGIYRPILTRKISRPLVSSYVPAGFPSPAADYIEGRIDLNKDLIKQPFTTFYIRVIGDSMGPLISSGELLIVDRMPETKDREIIVARLGNDLCVKRLGISNTGTVWLCPENHDYKSIEIRIEDDLEVWGKVLHSIQSF